MAELLRKPTGEVGKVHDVSPADAGWGYVGFTLYRLKAGIARQRRRETGR